MSRPVPSSASGRLLDVLAHGNWTAPPPLPPTAMEGLVRDCLEVMPARKRILLLERYYEQLTFRQIAERHGWPNRGSAHWAVRRALGELGRRVGRVLARTPEQEDV
jgi:DNA-directed RNA polymerase specialized sigma24 family protein